MPKPVKRPSILLPVKSISQVAADMGISVAEAARLERSALLKAKDALQSRGFTFRELLALLDEPNP